MAMDVKLALSVRRALFLRHGTSTGRSVAWRHWVVRKPHPNSALVRILVLIMWIWMLTTCVVAVGENKDDKWNELPGLKGEWDGIAFHEFRWTLWFKISNALGSISQDGWTLLQTANDQDAGGPADIAAAAAAVPIRAIRPEVITRSENRNHRLFACLG